MKIQEIHNAITAGVNGLPGQSVWDDIGEYNPEWNDYIIMAQRIGVTAVIDLLNSPDKND